jgi:hypothetical protein
MVAMRQIKGSYVPMTFWLSGVSAMVNTESYITLLVNPTSKSEALSKVISEHKVRHGYKIEHWGDNLRRVSMSGSTLGFYTSNGLTRFSAEKSESYQEFMKFFRIFLNNGINWVKDPLGGQYVISTVGRVNFIYDSQKYTGSFDNFKLSEDAKSPFTLKYDFEFTATHYEQIPNTLSYASF